MVRKEKARKPITLISYVLWLALLATPRLGWGYTDEILLKAPKEIYTTYDVKSFALIRNLYDNQILVDVEDPSWQKEFLKDETKAMMEHLVVSKYLIQSQKKDIDLNTEKKKAMEKKLFDFFKSASEKNTFLNMWHIQEKQMVTWMKQRSALETFLQTYPPFQVIMTDQKILDHYQANKQDRFLNKDFEEIKNVIEEDFKQQHLKTSFGKWMNSEMRRQRWKIHE